MVAVLFSAASVLTLLLGVGSYALAVKRGTAPSVPVAVGLSLLFSTGLALAGLPFTQSSGGPLWLVLPLALVSLVTTSLLLLLHFRRHVVALSKDTPEAARRHRERDALRFTLLCDPELQVIRQYGVEHRKALEISDGPRVSLLGMAVGTRPSFRHMAAPTTLLVDETGVIRSACSGRCTPPLVTRAVRRNARRTQHPWASRTSPCARSAEPLTCLVPTHGPCLC